MTRACASSLPARHRALWCATLLFGCGSLYLVATPLAAMEQVTLQLKWHHQFQFAGYYAALFKGYYRDAGLQVTLREGKPGSNVIEQVISNQAHYGVGGSDLVQARAAGQPVVVMAAIMQHSPLGILALQRAQIQQLPDLAGKRLMLEPHAVELLSYLYTQPLRQQPILVPHTQGVEALLRGQVDAMSAYSTDEPYQLMQKGIPYRLLNPLYSGIDFYGDTLFTSEQELQHHPDRVLAFHHASLKGWQYAMSHQEEVIDWLLTHHPNGHTREQLAFEARETEKLIQPNQVAIGYMHEARWQQIASRSRDLGQLDNIPDFSRLLYSPERAVEQQKKRLQEQNIALSQLITLALLALATVFSYLYLSLRKESRNRQQLTHKLAQSEQHYRFVAEHSADVIWTLEVASRRFRYLSPAVYSLCGWTVEEAMALPLKQIMTDASIRRLARELGLALAAWRKGDYAQTRRVIRLDLHHKNGQQLATQTVTTLHGNEEGEPEAIIGVTRDITEQAAVAESMERLAFYDPLTSLPNRRLLLKRLNEALAEQGEQPLALLFIDLDHFKPINDTLGHEVGDALLIMLAERMNRLMGEQGVVARLGGDEFVVMLCNTGHDALRQADLLQHNLNSPYHLNSGQELRISCSIGVALYPEHGRDARELMHNADLAMYQAKHGGRSQVCLYLPDLDLKLDTLQWSESHLCGHPRIDAEHRQLFALANRLLEKMRTRETQPEGFKIALGELLDATSQHFAFEEKVLSALDFKELDAHRAEHQRLLTRALTLANESQNSPDNHDFLNFILQEMVVGHMNHTDRRYFPLLRAQALSQSKEAVA